MKQGKEVWKLVSYNWKPLVAFELLYKLVSVVIFTPFLWWVFRLAMRVGGYSYLTLENIGGFLFKPFTVFLLILIFLIATTCAMTDISAVIFTLEQSRQKVRITILQILCFSVKNALRAWNPQNFFLVVVVLLLMPFLSVGMASGFLSTLSVPEFIMDFINGNTLFSALFFALNIILLVLMFGWMYAFHYFTLENCNFREARKKSRTLSHKKKLRNMFAILLAQFPFSVLFVLFLLLAVGIAAVVGKLFARLFVLRWIVSTVIWATILLFLTIVGGLSLPISYGCISVLYYKRKMETGEEIIPCPAPQQIRNGKIEKWIHLVTLGVCGGTVVLAFLLGYLFCSGKINPQVEYVRRMEVTAHRGASVLYPENTMAAFRGAKELGADWIELDVQQTKDGQIIVVHDTNLKRTTGVSAFTWELTYEEIAKLEAGSFFSPEFAGERIPLLFEVAAFAKENDVRLNIELKPTGKETDFEKSVIDVIRAAGIEERCVITSQVYEVLENVKKYDRFIPTVYVMTLAYGDINKLEAADHFSVEATNATKSLISSVHNAGKQIFVWTVNTKESITRMAELNVDNIITDNIELAKQCIYESRYSTLLEEYIKLFQ